MLLEKRTPSELCPNKWNSNRLTPEAEIKLQNSLERHEGLFKPILVRTLNDGNLEIIGGEHRVAAAIRLGWDSIPVLNLGVLTDEKAKEISILDNGRYGQDDAVELSKILSELGSLQDLSTYMPFDLSDLEHMAMTNTIDLDSLDLDPETSPEIDTTKPPRIAKTHVVMRVKIPVDDHDIVETTLKQIITDQALSDSDSLVNAGDALIWLIRRWINLEDNNGSV